MVKGAVKAARGDKNLLAAICLAEPTAEELLEARAYAPGAGKSLVVMALDLPAAKAAPARPTVRKAARRAPTAADVTLAELFLGVKACCVSLSELTFTAEAIEYAAQLSNSVSRA